MNTEKQRAFIIHFLYYAIILTMIFIFFRYIIYSIMPFLIGFTIAFMLRPFIKRLSKWTKGHDKAWAICTILLFYLTIGIFITILSIKGFQIIQNFVENLPHLYSHYLEPLIDTTLTNIESLWQSNDPALTAIGSFLDSISSSLSSLLTSFSKSAMSIFTSFASSLPNVVISFFFAIISSFFFASDYTHITSFISRQLPEKQREIMFAIRHFISGTVMSFIIAY